MTKYKPGKEKSKAGAGRRLAPGGGGADNHFFSGGAAMAWDGRWRLGAAVALMAWALAWGAGPRGGNMGLFADDDTAAGQGAAPKKAGPAPKGGVVAAGQKNL